MDDNSGAGSVPEDPTLEQTLPEPELICFGDERTARLIQIAPGEDLGGALMGLGLLPPRRVLVLVGGAAGLSARTARRLERLFRETLAPLVDDLGAIAIDGGTDAGVMSCMGLARERSGSAFPLLGVAAAGTVRRPGPHPDPEGGHTPLEPHHSHFLLVPGRDWGDEAPWIGAAAGALSRGSAGITLVAGGGRITRADLMLSLRAGRPAVLLAGTGGTADQCAGALRAGVHESIGIGAQEAGRARILDLERAGSDLPGLLETLLRPAR
jgi:hypothetical protein